MHEDNHTCGFGAEVIATVAEQAKRHVIVRRVTRPDTFIPCHFESQLAVLPSHKRVLETCAELLDLEVTWECPVVDEATDTQPVRALGSGPADETVDVVGLLVQVGDTVTVGQLVAEVEATKSVVEVASTVAGVVAEICVALGQTIPVSGVLLRIRTADSSIEPPRSLFREDAGTPRLHERSRLAPRDERNASPMSNARSTSNANSTSNARSAHHAERDGYVDAIEYPVIGIVGIASRTRNVSQSPLSCGASVVPGAAPSTQSTDPSGQFMNTPQPLIYMTRPACALGSKTVSTESLAASVAGWTAAEAVKRTGVESRQWIGEGEDVVTLAVQAATQLLANLGSGMPPISAILCSTTTPKESSPSVACQVANCLSTHPALLPHCFAFDFNAACSGFLYGLRIASGLLHADPSAAILMVTSEVASLMLSPIDETTRYIFGDAATATLITAAPFGAPTFALNTPVCTAIPDPSMAIHLPCVGTSQYLRMDGIAVARIAYKAMANRLREAARMVGISEAGLVALVPHPGSKRILQNVAEELKFDPAKCFSTLSDTGNTSSSSIPLVLDRFWDDFPIRQPVGLTAFGAGFTSAAAIGHMTGDPT